MDTRIKAGKPLLSKSEAVRRPTREEAEEAVRTLLAWTGDDVQREGLIDTPSRVVDAFDEYFSGYQADAARVLGRTFEDAAGYDDLIVLKHIRVQSHCEHHMTPFLGVAHVGYVPNGRIVGFSRIARLVDVYARRLQTQERLTAEIAATFHAVIKPAAVGVLIKAEHQCMSLRGVRQSGVETVTTRFHGRLANDEALRARFLTLCGEAG